MLKVIRCMKPIDNFRQLKAWTRAVAKTVTYDWFRKSVKNQSHVQVTEGNLPILAAKEEETRIEHTARMVWIEQQIAKLPPETRRLFDMRYRLGWSLQKIAGQVGLKTGAVDGRIRRAIDKLKQQAESESDV